MENIVIISTLVIAGLLASVFRNIIPYLRKRQETEAQGQTLPFSGQYITSALLSVVTAIPIMVMSLPNLLSQLGDNASITLAFITGFTSVYTLNDFINERIEGQQQQSSTSTST